jgi:hypothetical protein
LQLYRSKPGLFANEQSEVNADRYSAVAVSFASKDHGTEDRYLLRKKSSLSRPGNPHLLKAKIMFSKMFGDLKK